MLRLVGLEDLVFSKGSDRGTGSYKPKDPEVLRHDLKSRWQQISPEGFHVFLQANAVTERHITSQPLPPTLLQIHCSPTVTQLEPPTEQYNTNAS